MRGFILCCLILIPFFQVLSNNTLAHPSPAVHNYHNGSDNDSLKNGNDHQSNIMAYESLIKGNIPLGKFQTPVNRLVHYNRHEKLYLGAGLSTSPQLSRYLSAGAYAGYGFGDKRIKYGGDVRLSLSDYRDFEWFFRFSDDNQEAGKIDPFSVSTHIFGEYRELLIQKMDHTKTLATGFQYKLFPFLLAYLQLEHSQSNPQYDYYFNAWGGTAEPQNFVFTELSAGVRFVYQEKIIHTSRSSISLGSDYPAVWFNFTKGIRGFLAGEFDYNRYDLKIEHSFYSKLPGKTMLLLHAGIISSDIPYTKLYAGFGSYGKFAIHSPGSFATMRMNEFTADHYISMFISHDFGNLFFRAGIFEPEFVIATHAGYGWLLNQHPENHSILIQSFEKGFFESGILLNNLLNMGFFNIGLGAFYRHGTYALPGFWQNASWRLSLNFPF